MFIEVEQATPYTTCQSFTYTLKYDYVLEFTSSSATPPSVLTVQPYSTLNTYSNYQWYRNGAAIVGANSSSYTAMQAGEYHVTADASSCGSRTSAAQSICEVPTQATNHNFTGTHSYSGTVSLDGNITIAPGADITINNATIYMSACSKITVANSAIANTNGGRLTITNSTIIGCGRWKGIEVNGDPTLSPLDNEHGKITMKNVTLSDAYFGLYVKDRGMMDLEDVVFENNRHHLVLENCPDMESEVKHCTFNYISPIVNWTACSGLPSIYYTGFASNPKLVYIYNSSAVKFSDCIFHALDLGALMNENGVEAYNTTVFNNNANWPQSLYFTGNQFEGIYDQAMYFGNCQNVSIVGTGTYFLDCNNTINAEGGDRLFVQYQQLELTNSSSTNKSGLRSSQSDYTVFANNIVKKYDRGAEFYDDDGFSRSIIDKNRFEENYIGIVLSSACYPVGNVSCNNAFNNTIDVEIGCNKILDNIYGIVGTGYCKQQGSQPAVPGNGGVDWSNMFCSGGGCPGSSNFHADVVWMNGGSPGIIINYDFNVNKTPLLTFLSGVNTLSLNNTNATSGNQSGTNLTERLITNPTTQCYGSWKTDPYPIVDKDVSRFSLYPNPANDLLNLNNPLDFQVSYNIIDQLGRKVDNGSVKPNSRGTIDISRLAQGTYYLRLWNESNTMPLCNGLVFVKTN